MKYLPKINQNYFGYIEENSLTALWSIYNYSTPRISGLMRLWGYSHTDYIKRNKTYVWTNFFFQFHNVCRLGLTTIVLIPTGPSPHCRHMCFFQDVFRVSQYLYTIFWNRPSMKSRWIESADGDMRILISEDIG